MLMMALVVGFLAFSGIPGYNHAQAAEQKTDAERKKYLDEQKRKIDKQAEREIDRVLDGQKGLGNSGASQRKIAEIERQRDAQKKALDDHYKQGSRNVVGLDGKRKGTPPSASAPNKTTGASTAKNSGNVVGLDGKRKGTPPSAAAPNKTTETRVSKENPAPKAPRYVVGVDGKRKLVNP